MKTVCLKEKTQEERRKGHQAGICPFTFSAGHLLESEKGDYYCIGGTCALWDPNVEACSLSYKSLNRRRE